MNHLSPSVPPLAGIALPLLAAEASQLLDGYFHAYLCRSHSTALYEWGQCNYLDRLPLSHLEFKLGTYVKNRLKVNTVLISIKSTTFQVMPLHGPVAMVYSTHIF